MGFMRKALFLGTGGASGMVVKANSKKDRSAKALEELKASMSPRP
jgi:hypothetical protein